MRLHDCQMTKQKPSLQMALGTVSYSNPTKSKSKSKFADGWETVGAGSWILCSGVPVVP